MLFNPFRLKSTLSSSANTGLDDTLNTKKALGSLGYYKASKQGLTKIADNPLFEGIKRFQSDNGLKRDGVMKPGGETEQAIRAALKSRRGEPKPVSTAKPNARSSLLDPLPSPPHPLMPGERDLIDIPSPFPENTEQAQQQLKPLKTLLDSIARAARNNEVTSSNTRTVKAALKTTNHRDLAKVHATAVKEFGDTALAEIADFNIQLKAANPKAHNSWFRAFTEELPDDAERMVLASRLSDDRLRGSESNHTLNTEKQDGLNEETVGVPPRKPEQYPSSEDTQTQREQPAPMPDLTGDKDFDGINLNFIHEREKTRTDIYVPENNGKAIGVSGATVGVGVDLGQMDTLELRRLADQHDLPQGLIDRLKPYTGMKGQDALTYVENNPLEITSDEARLLTAAKSQRYFGQVEKDYR